MIINPPVSAHWDENVRAGIMAYEARIKQHQYMSESITQPAPTTFNVGDKVKKSKGFQFPGVIVSIFTTTQDARRVVVEAEHPEFKGMLHIYNPDQLELRD